MDQFMYFSWDEFDFRNNPVTIRDAGEDLLDFLDVTVILGVMPLARDVLATSQFTARLRTFGYYCNDLTLELRFLNARNKPVQRDPWVIDIRVPSGPSGAVTEVGDIVAISPKTWEGVELVQWAVTKPGTWFPS